MFATTKLPCRASSDVHTARGLVGLPSCEWPIDVAVAGAVRPACFVAPFIVRRACHAMPSCSDSVLLSRALVTSRHIQRRGMQQCGINQDVPPLAVCSSCASYDTHLIAAPC